MLSLQCFQSTGSVLFLSDVKSLSCIENEDNEFCEDDENLSLCEFLYIILIVSLKKLKEITHLLNGRRWYCGNHYHIQTKL